MVVQMYVYAPLGCSPVLDLVWQMHSLTLAWRPVSAALVMTRSILLQILIFFFEIWLPGDHGKAVPQRDLMHQPLTLW